MRNIVKFAIMVLFLALMLNIIFQNRIEKVEAEQQIGFFEGEVPIYGAYLKTINSVPGYSGDENEDGVSDRGYSSDSDGDGIVETRYVEEPLIVDLQANGFFPGDKIMISYKQSIHHDMTFTYQHLYGLFSSSNELFTEEFNYNPGDNRLLWPMVGPDNRVPGAIDATLGGYSHKESDVTYGQGPWIDTGIASVPNDIPEDFRITKASGTINGERGDPWTQDKYFFSNGFWITIPPGGKYLFLQLHYQWMIYQSGNCSVTIDKDTDGDAIPDSWEENGIDFNKDGLIDLVLEDADFMKKDVYVEVDYMGSSGSCAGHNPFSSGSLYDVQYAFENAPAESVKNPDGSAGIVLHIDGQEADEIPHQDVIKAFDDIKLLKKDYFGTKAERTDSNEEWILRAKKWTYRYSIFVHQYSLKNATTGTWQTTTSSGIAESASGCDDFIISLGGFSTNPGTTEEQASTFMHELGHALGLKHGGGDEINYKPNYLSVMNYLFQFDSRVKSRPLDYSSIKLDTLDEKGLDELKGLGVNQVNSYDDKSWYQTAYSVFKGLGTYELQITLLMPIDWDNNTNIEPDQMENINNFPQWEQNSQFDEKLHGWNDWLNLEFYFQKSDSFAQGFEPYDLQPEITWEIAQEINDVWDQFEPLIPPDPDSNPPPSGNDENVNTNFEIGILVGLVVVCVVAVIGYLLIKKKNTRASLFSC